VIRFLSFAETSGTDSRKLNRKPLLTAKLTFSGNRPLGEQEDGEEKQKG
jgi:hypothetical protein